MDGRRDIAWQSLDEQLFTLLVDIVWLVLRLGSHRSNSSLSLDIISVLVRSYTLCALENPT